MISQTQLDLKQEYWQSVKKEKERFFDKGLDFAQEYLSSFGIVGKVLAELRVTDNASKYRAAKDLVNEMKKNNYQLSLFD